MRNIAYDNSLGIHLLIHNSETPDNNEWDFLLSNLLEHPNMRTIVIPDGGGPSPLQRVRVGKLYASTKTNPRTAVINSGFVANCMLTAFKWFKANLYIVKRGELDLVYQDFGIPEGPYRDSITGKLKELMSSLGISDNRQSELLGV